MIISAYLHATAMAPHQLHVVLLCVINLTTKSRIVFASRYLTIETCLFQIYNFQFAVPLLTYIIDTLQMDYGLTNIRLTIPAMQRVDTRYYLRTSNSLFEAETC
jgi:hypothetical protein